MNKTAILFLLVTAVFFSCSKKKENSSRHSTGKINSISIVIDDQLWKGAVGDSLRNKFASPVEGLPKEEPLFDIDQYSSDVMEGFVTRNRAVVVVKLGNENSFSIQENQYATPQNIFHITGESVTALLKLIEKNAPMIITIVKKGELAAHQEMLKDSITVSKPIWEQFKIDLGVPKNYTFSIKNEKFVWLKKEFFSGSTSILVSQFPLKNFNRRGDVLSRVVKIHDSIGALYIKGTTANSNMYVDTSYPLYLLKTKLDGKEVWETKGTWRLKNSFMFGPFQNYLIVDSKKNRIIYLEGFCYVSSQERRDYMHELEAILKDVKISE